MYDTLVDLIVNYVEVKKEDISPESRFVEDLGFDSFTFMTMLGELEEKFDVELNPDELGDIRTVQEAVDYIDGLKK